jgi:L-histidine N-alpha-methyltransferase
MLLVLNHELGADFDPDAFEHRAFYDTVAHRIEMHLVSTRPQVVEIPGLEPIALAAGESIRTEISTKYDRDSVAAFFAAAGLRIEAWPRDPATPFGLVLGARA